MYDLLGISNVQFQHFRLTSFSDRKVYSVPQWVLSPPPHVECFIYVNLLLYQIRIDCLRNGRGWIFVQLSLLEKSTSIFYQSRSDVVR